MEFVRIIENCDHLWAVKAQDKTDDELTDLFNKWNNVEYLLNFFTENFDDLRDFFHIERISEQEREHTRTELDKLNHCKAFLKSNGVFDRDSFVELTND